MKKMIETATLIQCFKKLTGIWDDTLRGLVMTEFVNCAIQLFENDYPPQKAKKIIEETVGELDHYSGLDEDTLSCFDLLKNIFA